MIESGYMAALLQFCYNFANLPSKVEGMSGMKQYVTLFISCMMIVSCNASYHGNVVGAFQKELNTFLESSNTKENVGTYCLILFKTVPDSTVSFISSEYPHILTDEHKEIRYKVYARGGDTLIVCSPKDYRFEQFFLGWRAVDEIIFSNYGPRFNQRANYTIRGDQLQKIL